MAKTMQGDRESGAHSTARQKSAKQAWEAFSKTVESLTQPIDPWCEAPEFEFLWDLKFYGVALKLGGLIAQILVFATGA